MVSCLVISFVWIFELNVVNLHVSFSRSNWQPWPTTRPLQIEASPAQRRRYPKTIKSQKIEKRTKMFLFAIGCEEEDVGAKLRYFASWQWKRKKEQYTLYINDKDDDGEGEEMSRIEGEELIFREKSKKIDAIQRRNNKINDKERLELVKWWGKFESRESQSCLSFVIQYVNYSEVSEVNWSILMK